MQLNQKRQNQRIRQNKIWIQAQKQQSYWVRKVKKWLLLILKRHRQRNSTTFILMYKRHHLSQMAIQLAFWPLQRQNQSIWDKSKLTMIIQVPLLVRLIAVWDPLMIQHCYPFCLKNKLKFRIIVDLMRTSVYRFTETILIVKSVIMQFE